MPSFASLSQLDSVVDPYIGSLIGIVVLELDELDELELEDELDGGFQLGQLTQLPQKANKVDWSAAFTIPLSSKSNWGWPELSPPKDAALIVSPLL